MKIETVIDYFKSQPLMYLATIDGNQPKVRPMALIYHTNTCWFVSIAGRKKIKEIEINDNIEFAINPQDREDLSTIRGTGRAVLIDDQELRQDLANVIPWFDEYWESAEDSNFFLYKIDLEQVSVQIPVKRDIYIFNIKTGKTDVRSE